MQVFLVEVTFSGFMDANKTAVARIEWKEGLRCLQCGEAAYLYSYSLFY